MEKILSFSVKLNSTPIPLGCYGFKVLSKICRKLYSPRLTRCIFAIQVSYANPTRGDRGQLPENPGNNKTPSPGISFPITPNSQQQPRTPEKSSVVTPKSKRAKPSSAAKKASSAKSGARPGSPASPRASAPEQVGKIQLPLPYVFLALLTKLTRRIRFWLKNPLNIPTVEISHNQGSWVRFWVTQNFSFTPLRRLRPLSKAPNTCLLYTSPSPRD